MRELLFLLTRGNLLFFPWGTVSTYPILCSLQHMHGSLKFSLFPAHRLIDPGGCRFTGKRTLNMWQGSRWRWLSCLCSQCCSNFPTDFWTPIEMTRMEGRREIRGNYDFIIQQEFVRKQVMLGDHQMRRLSLPTSHNAKVQCYLFSHPPSHLPPDKVFLSSPYNVVFHGMPAYQDSETMWDMHADNGPVSQPRRALKGSLSALTDCSVFP